MTDTYVEGYWDGDWDDYEGLPEGLAQRIHDWTVSYVLQHVGVNLADGTTDAEEEILDHYFENWGHLGAYMDAMVAAPWYSELVEYLAKWDDSGLESDDDFFQIIDDADLQLSAELTQAMQEWAGAYIQSATGINVLDDMTEGEEALLENYFSNLDNLQAYVEAMMAAPWFQQWESVYNKAVAEGRVDGDDSLFDDLLDDGEDDVELWDDDGNLWDAQIVRPDGVVIEAEEAQLYRAYSGAMGRTPDEAGYNWWLGEIQAGRQDLNSMAGGFIHSDEFQKLADLNDDHVVDNAEFINHMYEGVFGRVPDQAGFDYWVGELDGGYQTQADAFVGMTQSAEYVQKTYMTVADMLLV